MKKNSVVAILLAGIMAFALSGCNKVGAVVEVLPSYNNITDFSNQQGFRNWYYLYTRSDEDGLQKMVFDNDSLRYNGRDLFSFVEMYQMHPGNNGETILAFKAPKSGKIDITGKLTRCPTDFAAATADGVFVYVAGTNLDDDYLFSQTLAKDKRETVEFSLSREVKQGDFTYFVLNANGNNSFDNTKFDITILYN